MSLAQDPRAMDKASFLFIRKNGKHQRVFIQDILYVAAAGSYLVVVTAREQFSLSQNLSHFLRKNSIPSLVRVHRSFIANLLAVDSFDHAFIYLGEHQIPIGEAYKDNFFSAIRVL
jgi:DNA-binding LytR/AlgR family response regulator